MVQGLGVWVEGLGFGLGFRVEDLIYGLGLRVTFHLVGNRALLRNGGAEHQKSRTGGPDVIRKEAWCFYRTISGVRLCWELEEAKGPKERAPARTRHTRATRP